MARPGQASRVPHADFLQQAINCDDADRVAKLIQDALGVESDDVVNYCFPKDWPADGPQ